MKKQQRGRHQGKGGGPWDDSRKETSDFQTKKTQGQGAAAWNRTFFQKSKPGENTFWGCPFYSREAAFPPQKEVRVDQEPPLKSEEQENC